MGCPQTGCPRSQSRHARSTHCVPASTHAWLVVRNTATCMDVFNTLDGPWCAPSTYPNDFVAVSVSGCVLLRRSLPAAAAGAASSGREDSIRGRRATSRVGVDVHRCEQRLAVCRSEGEGTRSAAGGRGSVVRPQGPDALMPMSPAALHSALSRDIPLCLERAQRARVRAVGISWPTALSPATGVPLLAHLLWRRKSIASFLDDCKDVLRGLPVVSVNDANADPTASGHRVWVKAIVAALISGPTHPCYPTTGPRKPC